MGGWDRPNPTQYPGDGMWHYDDCPDVTGPGCNCVQRRKVVNDRVALLRRVEEKRKDPEFMGRLQRIVDENAEVLARLAEDD